MKHQSEQRTGDLRTRNVDVPVLVVSYDTMVENEGTFMRTHLLCSEVPFPRYMKYCKLRVLPVPYCRAPVIHHRRTSTYASTVPWICTRWIKSTNVVFSSFGIRSSIVAILTQFHCSGGVETWFASNFCPGKLLGQSAGRCWPRSTMISVCGRVSSCPSR